MLPARAVVHRRCLPRQLALVLSAVCAWTACLRSSLLFCVSTRLPSSGKFVSSTMGGRPVLPVRMLRKESIPSFAAASFGASSLILLAMAAASPKSRRTLSCGTKAIPTKHVIPVVDLEGKQVGDETLQFRTFSKDTANYVVHHAHMIWQYQQIRHTEFHPRLGDRDQGIRHGKKLWKNKGVGRARMGSTWGTLFGKTATNKAKHGLDNKKRKKLMRDRHSIAISTVLQSKWRNMIIVDGLEDWPEARYYEMQRFITKVTGIPAGDKFTLMIARKCYGKEHKAQCVPTWASYTSPLYMSGRLIEKFQMRRPRDIDPLGDGLHQCLKARRLIISREAFHDLKAKYDARKGWIFKDPTKIMVEQLQKLVKDYPYDRVEEFEATRALPLDLDGREFWAKDRREEEAQAALE